MQFLVLLDKEEYRPILTRIMVDLVEIDPAEIQMELWIGPQDAFDMFIEFDPEVIITCGEEIMYDLTGKRGILAKHGHVDTSGDVTVVPILSPGYIKMHPDKLPLYVGGVVNAYHVALGITAQPAANTMRILRTFEEFEPFIEMFETTGRCSFDFETSKIGPMATFAPDFQLRTLALSFQHGSAIVLALEEMTPEDKQAVVEALNDRIFGNPDIIKVGQYIKFDMHCAILLGITKFEGLFHCTLLMSHLIDENESHKLKDMIRTFFPRYGGYEAILGEFTNWMDIPLDGLAEYNALDSDLTLRLYDLFTDMLLESDRRIYNLYRTLVAPAMKVLFRAEQTGMLIDLEYLDSAIQATEDLIASQEQKMRNHADVQRFEAIRSEEQKSRELVALKRKRDLESEKTYKTVKATGNQKFRIKEYDEKIVNIKTGKKYLHHVPLNFSSTTQMAELLYQRDGFAFERPLDPISGQLKTGTGKDVLLYIKDKSGFIDQLLSYRQLKLILSTYLKGIKTRLDSNHYIHTSFNQHITKTGRLSSTDPNLQNIITRTKYAIVEEAVKYVKRSFIMPQGYSLFQIDFSQAELRLMAHYSQDKAMLEAYRNNQDLHELTAASARNMTLEDFKNLPPKDYKQFRYEAKAHNFGFIYKISAPGFQDYARIEYGITISRKQAQAVQNAFFTLYPKILEYHKLYINKGRKFGYVRTMFGRKIRLPDLESPNSFKRGHAERNTINSPIQGTVGEMTIFAFTLLSYRLNPRVFFINTGHDSIIYYIPDDLVEETLPIIKKTMEELPIKLYFDKELTLPMQTDFERSKESWGQLEPYV